MNPHRPLDNVSKMAEPRILITPWRRELPTFLGERTLLDTLDPAYADRVAEAGGRALIVPRPPADVEAAAEEVLELADGLLLSGGGDVDPASYRREAGVREDGDATVGGLEDVDPAADAWEILLARGAAARGLPTLGICRGAQILAVAFGGALLAELGPEAAHRALADLGPDEILADRHPVTIRPGSRAADVYGVKEVTVNTIHHQAIADTGSLAASAEASGGLIEAVEPDAGLHAWPALGVQWHPEKMPEPEQRRAFDWLVRGARERRSA
jgi:putative glutamine amidotransferase